MIWLDDEGRIVMRTEERYQGAERIVGYQRALIHLLQNQPKDAINEDIHWDACELLNNLLPSDEQISRHTIDFHQE